eukprot:TRINITY_DN12817_c0_g1_i1.p1 TRINITY_DN12817_c0_g1~~TRINITY_DN12817_c0_g1_i1.p1  ORF type:complete len:452 (+),score=130.24 TRINITY_DN12817_c0_g1_i1:59-1357(+)
MPKKDKEKKTKKIKDKEKDKAKASSSKRKEKSKDKSSKKKRQSGGESREERKSKREKKNRDEGVIVSEEKPVEKKKQRKLHENFVDELCDADNGKKVVGKEDFDLLAVIGRGSFGKVMQVREKKTNKVYAMKVMRKDAIIAKNQVAHTKDEKHILAKIQHPFIVRLNYAFQTSDKLYMIMDYINGGELFFHLKNETRFPEERVKFYAAEIALALMHLHDHGIIYRDLKPENILLDHEGHIVITDFGLSKEVFDDFTDTFCGTPEYLAPEVLRGGGHTFPVDWWSLGTLMYEMIVGIPPFYSKSISVMYQKIMEGPLRFPEGMSEDVMDLLEGLLERDPDERLTSEEIREHPFFADVDWEKMEAKKITPPWKPNVRDEFDTTHIDPHFTSQVAADSLVTGPSWIDELSEEERDMFEGFTFGGDDVLNQSSDST